MLEERKLLSNLWEQYYHAAATSNARILRVNAYAARFLIAEVRARVLDAGEGRFWKPQQRVEVRLLVEVFKGSAKAAIRPLRPSPVPSRSRSRGLAPAAPAWPRRRRRSRPRPPGREGGEGARGSRSFGLWGILIAVARARVLDADAGEGRRIHVRGDIGALLYASDLSFPSHTRSCTWRHLAAWRLAPLGGLHLPLCARPRPASRRRTDTATTSDRTCGMRLYHPPRQPLSERGLGPLCDAVCKLTRAAPGFGKHTHPTPRSGGELRGRAAGDR